MTELNQILAQLKPCDTTRPYAFVSYSNSDCRTVWADVLQFQQNGYNIWMDEKNLDRTRDSWNEDALQAINSRRCQLVLFYVSSTSLCSPACLEELRETVSERAKANHMGKVPILAIEVEPIRDLAEYARQAHRQMSDRVSDEKEFSERAEALWKIMEEFFPRSNDRVRIHAKDEPDRKGEYFQDIQQYFGDGLLLSPPRPAEPVPVSPVAPEPQPAAPAAQPAPPPAAPEAAAGDLYTTKTLGTTDIKYNICTFGSGFHIGAGVPVTLVMDGKRYERKMHNTVKGRVDGLKQLYADQGLQLGDVLEARYSAAEHTIYLTRGGSAR